MSVPPVQPVAIYTGSLQYEDSTSCTLYRLLLPRRQFEFAPFFAAARKIFTLSKKLSLALSFVGFLHPSIHPFCNVIFDELTLFHKNSRAFVKFSVSSSSYSPILSIVYQSIVAF
jgi:hypothetical protein